MYQNKGVDNMQMTVSISVGKSNETSISHNNRKTNLENADDEKKKKFYEHSGHEHIWEKYTNLNEDIKIIDPKHVYDEKFEQSILDYNKGKKPSRQIGKGKAITVAEKEKGEKGKTLGEAYYNKLKTSKKGSPTKEFIFQIGNATDFNKTDKDGNLIDKDGNIIADDDENRTKKFVSLDRKDPDGIWQKSAKVLKDYVPIFEKNNPNLEVVDVSLHMDESSPHIHCVTVPIADTDKTTTRGKKHVGMAKTSSFNGALECEGFAPDSKDRFAQIRNWQHKQADDLAKVMKDDLDIDRKKGISNKFKNFKEYKQAQAKLAEQNAELKMAQDAVEAQNQRFSENRDKLDKLDEYDSLVSSSKKQLETNNNTLKTQNAQISENKAKLAKLAHYDDLIADSQKRLKTNENMLKMQNTLIQQNKPKLDTLSDYDTLVINAQSKLKMAENKRKQEENARDIAEQEKKDAETARDKANEEAKNANANYLAQLNAREQELDAREDSLSTREDNVKTRENKLKDDVSRFNERMKETRELHRQQMKRESAWRKIKTRFYEGFYHLKISSKDKNYENRYYKVADDSFKGYFKDEGLGYIKRNLKNFMHGILSVIDDKASDEDISDVLASQPEPQQPSQPKQVLPDNDDIDLDL